MREHVTFKMLVNASSSSGRRELATLSDAQLQAFIGEYLESLTDGVVECTLVDNVVTTRVVGKCSEIQPLLEEIVNDLLNGMSIHFGRTFVYTSISCDTSVISAPSPPPPLPPPSPPQAHELEIDLNWGWTWVSFNIEAADMSLNTIFSSVPLENGDHVKSQFLFTQYYAGYGFFGTLATLDPDSMYAVNMQTPQKLRISGTPLTLPRTITVGGRGSWTFLPCPYLTPRPLAAGMPTGITYGADPATSDRIKSQFSFSSFYPGYGWFGNLDNIQPGEGYMLWVQGPGGPAIFQS